jgi:hypothetical protein
MTSKRKSPTFLLATAVIAMGAFGAAGAAFASSDERGEYRDSERYQHQVRGHDRDHDRGAYRDDDRHEYGERERDRDHDRDHESREYGKNSRS